MRCAFFGTPDFAAAALSALLASRHDVVGVVGQPDKPPGRGQRPAAPPVKPLDGENDVPVLQPKSVRNDEFRAALRNWRPDVAVVAAYGKILPVDVLHLPRHGCINIHASLLPRYRGAAPIQWAIARGDEVTGITIMQMDEGMDTGAILMQRETPIGPDDTGQTLHDRLAELGAALVLKALDALERGDLGPVPQDDRRATLAPMLHKDDGRIDWSLPAIEIERRIRAFHPWPSAYTFLGEKRLRIHRARLSSIPARGEPGTVVAETPDLCVVTGARALRLLEVQLEGRKRMTAADFVRGGGLHRGARLG